MKLLTALLGSLALTVSLFSWSPVRAQVTANVVTTCGTPNGTYANGTNRPVTQGTDGKLCTSGSGGGGGGAVTIADGADVTQGTTTDSACATDNGTCTINAVIKRIAQRLTTINTTLGTPMQQTGGSVTANAGTNLNTSALVLDSTVGVSNTNLVLLSAPYAAPLVCNATASMTGTTPTSLCAAAGSSKNNYITQIICGNSSAAVGTFVDVEDGSGGTVLAAIPAGTNYQGGTLTFGPQGLKQPTANTALFVVNETTGAAVKCSAVGYTK